MIKTEQLRKHGIINVFNMDGIIDCLFSFNELDPMFWATSDGFSLSGGKPFITQAYIGPFNAVVATVIVFDGYDSKVRFVQNGIVLLHE